MPEFYIGYLKDTPPSYKKWGQRVALLLLSLAVLLGLAWAYSQGAALAGGVYQYSKTRYVDGFLHADPVPRLRVFNAMDEHGKPIFKSFLLVGNRKFGAAGITQDYLASLGDSLDTDSVYVQLKGILIYNDGKALLELTEGEDAFVRTLPVPDSIHPQAAPLDSITDHFSFYQLETTLQGEIIDPKCYFGAMKPGRGKVHKSCAIRCISGGIPPVLLTDDGESHQYYILYGQDQQSVNEAVLDYVAEAVEITGRFEPLDDWFVLYLDPTSSIKTLQ